MRAPAIVPRSAISVPDPGSRQTLAPRLAWLLGHYTGVNGYNDPTKDSLYARMVASYGRSAGKPYEYNYLIGLGGTIFEQAGTRLGSHCLHFNEQSIGILLMLGIGVQPTAAMLDSARQLRAWLVEQGRLHPQHQFVPHYRFRATGCPGNTIADPPGKAWASPTGEGRLGELHAPFLAPWAEPEPIPIETIPTPQPVEDDDMARLIKADDGDNAIFAVQGLEAVWCQSRKQIQVGQQLGTIAGTNGGGEIAVPRGTLKALTLVGPVPSYEGMPSPPARVTVVEDFARQVV